MKYLFEFASAGHPPTHPYALNINFEESPNGWSDDNLNFKTGADWLNHIQRKLLVLGITDVFCLAKTPDTANKQAHNFTFYFTNAAQYFQFQASTTPNIKGNFVRGIGASTKEESIYQERNIRQFFDEHEIQYAMTRRDPFRLIVTTSYQQDDLIFAMRLANKSFNTKPETVPITYKPRLLLTSNENV